ncbi:MAG TPA: mannitol dehydrogenase family protein [Trebonia sp.]|nr:mannitol dehydrogenase family protein [Trebonia sp.]
MTDAFSADRLSLAELARVPAAYRPAVDPRQRRVRIVHLGIGAFHRAHQAYYTEESGDWGTCGVTQRSTSVLGQLGPQDGLYTLLVRDGTEARPRVLGTIREVLFAGADPAAVVARIASPDVSVVSLTVSEKGYRHDPATRRLRLADPEIAADLAGRPPHTVIGQLAAGLAARAASGAGPVTVVCCDNLPDNGPTVRGLVLAYAEAYAAARPATARPWAEGSGTAGPGAAALPGWIEAHAAFPATMVDRIVPAATDADRAEAAALIGVRDLGTVVAEPFTQWVIEDRFAAPRPAWEKAGAQFVTDVAPHEKVKLRMLNGAHSALAYLGGLAGYEFIAEALGDDTLVSFAQRLMLTDASATVDAPAGMEPDGYAAKVIRRFENAALRHRCAQIAMDGSQKLPQRLLGTVRDRLAAGATPVWTGLAVAAWMRHVWTERTDDGRPFTVDDPMAGLFRERLAAMGVSPGGTAPGDAGAGQARAVAEGLLGIRAVFGDLADSESFRSLVTDHLRRLARDGALRTVAALVSLLAGAGSRSPRSHVQSAT